MSCPILYVRNRMASDKCIQVCSCVNVCLILAVIIYVSVTKKNLGSSTTVVSPSITQSPTEAPTIAPTMRRRLLRHPLELSTDALQIQSDVNREAGEYVFTSGTHLRGTTLILDEQALFFQKRSFFSFFWKSRHLLSKVWTICDDVLTSSHALFAGMYSAPCLSYRMQIMYSHFHILYIPYNTYVFSNIKSYIILCHNVHIH